MFIESYTAGLTFQEFSQDQKCRDAVERCLMRISEAATKLRGWTEQNIPDQPWSAIRGLGNLLRHEYDGIDPVVIWQIVTEDMDSLKRTVETTLISLRNNPPTLSKS